MQMVKAIKSGDLSGAQQAYATLDQMQSSGQIAAPDPNSPFAAALKQIGQSLQNGDLAGARIAGAARARAPSPPSRGQRHEPIVGSCRQRCEWRWHGSDGYGRKHG
jgi:hypothetical protein